MDQPTAEHAIRQLEPLVGEWTIKAKWPDGEPWSGGGRVTFEWHASGCLSCVTSPAGQKTRYAYDAFGRRLRKSGTDGRDVR